MASLKIRNFSCVDEAHLELAQLTVLIGPQASGKSVISKLIYFFQDILSRQFLDFEEDETLEEFRTSVADDFRKWFPPSAWGLKKFEITFQAGQYFVKITRAATRKNVVENDNIRVNFSPWFEKEFEHAKALFTQRNKAPKQRDFSFEDTWRIRAATRKRLQDALKDDFAEWQLFVPAGRSFFTSVGKAMAAFEYSGMIDPLTVRFGRFFASARDERRGSRMVRRGSKPSEQQQRIRDEMMKELFGGNITFGRNQEYVVSDDGRKIPFASLSSGQQELLPLWLAIEFAQEGLPNSMVYIEEPEAHLFPTAQSQVVEFLASVIAENNAKMVVTTHSPYVLTQINTLLKAGQLAQQFPEARAEISKIVRERNWLKPNSTVAYAIARRRVIQITDDEGLLVGDYLDEVSGYLDRDFSSLLEIEVANER
ncbi:AAA family ATPase [Bradyrhizobium sp. DN5]|uniref:AAA family ATPase n=1 Tax=Bradyrhizobium sp. DN5 TaxID=3056950 RepID=UPI003524C638